MSEKLFHDIKGVIPQHVSAINTGTVQSDTPCVAIGMFVDESSGVHQAVILCAVQGGKILQVHASDLRINLSEEMKKSLAEVILTS
jgi:hypothetical protein